MCAVAQMGSSNGHLAQYDAGEKRQPECGNCSFPTRVCTNECVICNDSYKGIIDTLVKRTVYGHILGRLVDMLLQCVDSSVFQNSGHLPSWICCMHFGTTLEEHLVVFIFVQNLVGINQPT